MRSTKRERSEVERGRDAAAPSISSGRSAAMINSAARSSASAASCKNGQLDRVRKNQRNLLALLGGNVLREFQVNGAGALLLRNAKRLPYESRNHSGRDDLARELRQRLHRRHNIDDLEARLA